MWGYLRLRWWLSETSKNTTPPRAPNGTKKGRCRTKKRPIQKKAIIELHPWKMVWQNCPVSWKFWFPGVISLTMDCCSTQSKITPCNAALENHFELPNLSLKVVLHPLLLALVLVELQNTCKKKLNRKMLERPNICYIFEKLRVPRCQIWHSHVSIPFNSAHSIQLGPAHSTRPHNAKKLFT